MVAPIRLRYRAFLSYAHADIAHGRWLHKQLENFRIDKDLVGRTTPLGAVPANLRPIFRDREDFSGGHSLSDATVSALDQSAALIVLCSPTAAARPAVNEEVRLFRSRHPDRPVIPVILDGTWPDNFPPALRCEVTSQGVVTHRPVTILGSDLRESGDGKSLSLAKVVAGLTGLATNDLVRRAERDQRRRQRNWIVGLSTVVVALTGLSFWAELNRREAVTQRQLAEQRRVEAERNFAAAKDAANSLVLDIAEGLQDVEGMRAESVRRILDTAEQTMTRLAKTDSNNLELQSSRSVMLAQFGDVYARLSDPRALTAYEESLAIARRLTAADPQRIPWQAGLATSLGKLGNYKELMGDAPGAAKAHEEALAIFRQLAAVERDNLQWRRDIAAALAHIGDLNLRLGDTPAALKAYEESVKDLRNVAASDSGDRRWRRDLPIVLSKLASAKLRAGDAAGAQKLLEESITIRRKLAGQDPGNTEWQRDLAMSLNEVGYNLARKGNAPGALVLYEESLSTFRQLVRADPRNTLWQDDLAITLDKIGDARLETGDSKGALRSYEEGLAIMRSLTSALASNAVWQSGLSISLNKVAGTKLDSGDHSGALKLYEESLDIRRKLTDMDPLNREWRRDLSIGLNHIGDVKRKTGDAAGAQKNYEESAEILRKLVLAETKNTGWQSDLALVLGRIAMALADQGLESKAVAPLTQGRNIIAMLLAQSPGDAKLTAYRIWFEHKLADYTPRRPSRR